ncbi:FAD dependent oxidoreductase [Penicillium coprophilum]|uniref:FAD dependent oxidoreductase n=1 Tax=Penicillium coprophilum TaxID=36646 RepID=UPI0023A23EEF|nr:FAD dependent oxidoreductase [Penicillium coprophilum]KAJ5173544.1 FAD dependent oxidoreductase [Penicillium coprophilum]
MESKHTPVPNGMTSFWRTEPHFLDSHRSTESLPHECDIVVIGAGYAGASVVHHIFDQIAPRSKPPSIVILEARQACSGATGRNGGHMKPDLYNGIAGLAADHGVEAAAEVAAFEAKHVSILREFVKRENIDCEYTVTKAIDVQLSRECSASLKEGYEGLIKKGCEPTAKARYIPINEAEKFSGVKGAQGCFTYDAGHIWPYKFVLHLLEKAISQGVNLQTHTPVSGMTQSTSSTSGHSWIVNTARGSIAAKKVILATNAYTSSLVPQYKGKIIPVRGTCSRIVVPPGTTAPRLTNTYTLRWNNWNYDYLIPRADGSIVVGGARPAFIDDLDSWYNVSDDSSVLGPAIRYWDHYMQRNFVGWEDSHAYTDRVWTGIMGYSTDGLPHVGHVPGQKDQYIIAGFTGHGMPQIFLAAEGLAKMILGDVDFVQTGLPRLFKSTQSRLESHQNKIFASTPGKSQARL